MYVSGGWVGEWVKQEVKEEGEEEEGCEWCRGAKEEKGWVVG